MMGNSLHRWQCMGGYRSALIAMAILASAMGSVSPVHAEPEVNLAGEVPRITGDPFDQGSWVYHGYASAAFGDHAGEIYTAHAGLGYYFRDNLSVNGELLGGGIVIEDGPDDDASAVGINILFRWHFMEGEDWTVYLDGGAGLLQTSETFPASGTHFNFTPQGGIGGTLKLHGRSHLIGGVRWYHLSNNDKNGGVRNPGYDSALLYAGLIVPF